VYVTSADGRSTDFHEASVKAMTANRNRPESLKLVFALQPPSSPPHEIRIGTSILRFQPRTGTLAPSEALRTAFGIMRRFDIEPLFEWFGRQLPAEQVLEEIETTKPDWGGQLPSTDFRLSCAVVTSNDYCFFKIEELKPDAAGAWDVWVEPFLSKDGFVQAWIYDTEYDTWQNAESLQIYEYVGRDYSHLPLKPNNLPPPLDAMEVDISGNPGRWLHQQGYVEAIGAVMWLSDIFFERVGMDHKDRLASAEWVGMSEPAHGIVRIEVAESCFVDESTAKTQDRLRALLYR
jgi:hypothetical protein